MGIVARHPSAVINPTYHNLKICLKAKMMVATLMKQEKIIGNPLFKKRRKIKKTETE